MTKALPVKELDSWIKNCLIVIAGLLPEIPANLLSTRYPRKEEDYPKSFDWWLYRAFAAEYIHSGTPLGFSGILQYVYGDGTQGSPYKLLFGFQTDDDLGLGNDFDKIDLLDLFEEQVERLVSHQDKIHKASDTPKILVCPECESQEVATEHHQMFMVNTGTHYLHSMDPQDHDSPATCLSCPWKGERDQLLAIGSK